MPLRLLLVGAVAGVSLCPSARCCSLGLRVCLSVRAWLCAWRRVRVARLVCARAVVRLVSGGVFCYARRSASVRLFVCRLQLVVARVAGLLRFILVVGYCVVCVS